MTTDDLVIPARRLDKNQAQFYLAAIALARLTKIPADDEMTRAELFSPIDANLANVDILRKQGMARAWQQRFLDKLVGLGLITKNRDGSSVTYSLPDDRLEHVAHIIRGIKNEDGTELKRIMWPHLYPDVEDEEDEDESEAAEDEEVIDEADVGVLKELTDQLTTIAESLRTIAARFQAHEEMLQTITQTIKSVANDSLEFRVSAIATQELAQEVMKRLVSEDRERLSQIATLTVEHSAKRKSLLNQLDAQGRKEEKLLSQLEELTQSMKGKDSGK